MSSLSQRVEPDVSVGGFDLTETLPVPVLVFDDFQICRMANASARTLFGDVDLVGAVLPAVFASWPSCPRLVKAAGPLEPACSTVSHADGRLFTCQSVLLPDATVCLTLSDISIHLREAERDAQDALTGLPLRRALYDRLAEIIARSGRDGGAAAVHHIDLDRFKEVNDSLGYPIGDALLVKVAQRLRSTLREGDVLARLGGDEFVVVQFRADGPEAAQALGSRLVDLVSRTYVVEGHMVNVGGSVGIAMFPGDGGDADTLLRHADLALHKAKADGRGLARFFESSMNQRMQARRALEVDLRRALALRQFRLCFQPLVNLANNTVTGFEALLRWDHPARGQVSPADFIPLAEEIGLIVPIGEWVLRSACREAMSWPEETTVAVNISPIQFKGNKLAQTVTSALAHTGLAPERLELEITEGALLDETSLVVETLHAVRKLGVRISMDDFGTGYSSLSYLRKFPFDKIKIDQSFVKGLGGDADCDAIVRAVAKLGASLGMRTTAEGVETSDQLERVRSEGCTEVQGYYTGRPLSVADVAALLRKQTGKD